MILGDYLEYSAVITVKETQLNCTEEDVLLPSIKICNLNPVQSDHKMTMSNGDIIPSVDEFVTLVDNVTSCTNRQCTATEESSLKDIKQSSTTYEGYFTYCCEPVQ